MKFLAKNLYFIEIVKDKKFVQKNRYVKRCWNVKKSKKKVS